MIQRALCLTLAAIVLAVAAPAAEAATTQAFSTSQSPFTPGVRNQGWWSTTIPRSVSDNYIVQPTFFRDFFSFDLGSACSAVRVTLRVTRFDQTGPLAYSLFDVATPAVALNTGTGLNQAIYDDLGSGPRFGTFPVAPGAPSDVLSFALNGAGVSAFNAARGGSSPSAARATVRRPTTSTASAGHRAAACSSSRSPALRSRRPSARTAAGGASACSATRATA